MSVREFASHLGVNDAAVSSWERRGVQARLRYETQQLLDTDLSLAPESIRERFSIILAEERSESTREGIGRSTRDEVPDTSVLPSTMQDDVSTANPVAGSISADALSANSATRTSTLVATVQRLQAGISYVADHNATSTFGDFLASADRVFLLTGTRGSGKTQLTYHLAQTESFDVDFQLHLVDNWEQRSVDIATEILRFASIPRGDDSLLTLESICGNLTRHCVVVIDGIGDYKHLDRVGRQVDGVLRQVSTGHLRFVIVVRTPPDIDVSAYPILAASLFGPVDSTRPSFTMSTWATSIARQVWDDSRTDDWPKFADLPRSVQRLATVPLYMNLIHSAGDLSADAVDLNAFRLVGHCVHSILRRSGQPVDGTLAALSDLAVASAPHLVPPQLAKSAYTNASRSLQTGDRAVVSSLVESSPSGQSEFVHDVIREYAVAIRIADLIIDQGRSVRTVAALNELSAMATTSATARDVFEFVIYAIDDYSADFTTSVALAPSVSVGTTLPMMLGMATAGARFATDEVLRACAMRSVDDSAIETAKALLAHPGIADALGSEHAPWVVGLLRRFGAAIWSSVAAHLESHVDEQAMSTLVSAVSMDRAEEAIFVARYSFLFTQAASRGETFEQVLGHADWRVRAAVAECLLDDRATHSDLVEAGAERLVRDEDYKVRAAIAKAIAHTSPMTAPDNLRTLLADGNWHVRSSALAGVLRGTGGLPNKELAVVAERAMTHRVLATAPIRARKLVARVRLLSDVDHTETSQEIDASALLRLLREIRTGWVRLPEATCDSLVEKACASSNWLLRREADAIARRAPAEHSAGSANPRERYRRLRGGRAVQVALDVHELEHAVRVADAAADAGADMIEIGDPLIKAVGVRSIEEVKQRVPTATVVAEMMSADWGRDQVEMAVEAGADVVLLIGLTSTASVSDAVDAGHRLGAPIVLDISPTRLSQNWIREMERCGVDGFAVTTNIDQGIGVVQPLATARTVRSWTRLPISVSAGFSTADFALTNSDAWDVMIVGRSISEADNPAEAAETIVRMIHRPRERRR